MKKTPRPEFRLGGPRTTSTLELAYCLMAEAEQTCAPGEEGRFRAMDLHNWLLDLAGEHRAVYDAVYQLGLNERIGANQERLGLQ